MSIKTLNAGLDLTALFGSYAAAIQQAIEESYPNTPFSCVIYDSNPPDTFTYSWLKRALWVRPDGTGEITLNAYDDFVLHDWKNILTFAIPAGSIGTTQLLDGGVTLAKLTASGVSALQIIQRNGANNGWIFVNPADALSVNTIDPTKLIKPGSGDRMLTCIAGVIAWTLLSDILSYIADNSIGIGKITRGGSSTKGVFLATSPDGSSIGWVPMDPSLYLADSSIPLTKIAPGTNGQHMVTAGGIAAWATPVAGPATAILRYAPASATAPQSIPNTTDTTVVLDGAATFDPDGILTVGSNQFSLVAGKYLVRARTRVYGMDAGSARFYLYNKTDAAEVTGGSDTYTAVTADEDVYDLMINVGLNLTATKAFDLRVWHNFGAAKNLGVAASLAGKKETYVTIEVIRYA